ncbi:MAG TPA: hypothetical protein PLF56_08550 [Micropruina sp.]|jgi:hypothetical protein|nr:hypothetical protein [Micropruina sp.]
MTVGGSFPGTGAFMSYTTDQLRKDNALGEYELSPEEEQITIIQAPSAPASAHDESVDEPKQ